MIRLLGGEDEAEARKRGYDTSLYWIKSTSMDDPYSQGYVGITVNLKSRSQDHSRYTEDHFKKRPKSFKEEYYKGALSMVVLFHGDRESCLKLEKLMRPRPRVGWNLAEGGVFTGIYNHGHLYYSRILGKEDTLQGWASYSGKRVTQLRGFIKNGLSIDHAIGLKSVRKKFRPSEVQLDQQMVIEALYYSAKKPHVLFSEYDVTPVRYGSIYHKIRPPRYLWDNAIVDVCEGRYSILVPRQNVITSLADLSEIYDLWEQGLDMTQTDLARMYGTEINQMQHVLRCLDQAKYFSG